MQKIATLQIPWNSSPVSSNYEHRIYDVCRHKCRMFGSKRAQSADKSQDSQINGRSGPDKDRIADASLRRWQMLLLFRRSWTLHWRIVVIHQQWTAQGAAEREGMCTRYWLSTGCPLCHPAPDNGWQKGLFVW